jgi:hypothetical protein
LAVVGCGGGDEVWHELLILKGTPLKNHQHQPAIRERKRQQNLPVYASKRATTTIRSQEILQGSYPSRTSLKTPNLNPAQLVNSNFRCLSEE